MNIRFIRVFLIVLIGATLLACGGAEERKAKYMERGKAYFEEENYEKARIEFKNVLQIDPKMPEPYYYLGRIAESGRKWPSAFRNYKKAIELNPELTEPRVRLAAFYLLQASAEKVQGDAEAERTALARAAAEIDEVLKRAPDDSEALVVKASIAANAGDTDGAIAQLKEVLRLNPGNASGVPLLARLQETNGDVEGAGETLRAGITAHPDNIGLRMLLAQYYSKQDRPDDAVRVLQGTIDSRPEEYRYRKALSRFLEEQGKPGDAETVLREAIEADPDDPERYLGLAGFTARQKDVDQAIAELEDTVASKPDFVELKFGLVSLYQRTGKLDKATKVLDNIRKEYGTEPHGLNAANQLAVIYAAKSDFDEARKLVTAVLAENPKDGNALTMKGRLAMRDGDFPEAITSFRTVLKEQPDSVQLLNYLAEAHLRNGDAELAGETLRRAVDVEPDNPDTRIRLARFMIANTQDYEGAMEQISAALTAEETNVAALNLKLEVLSARGQIEQQSEVLEKILEVDPENTDASVRLARLKLEAGDPDAALEELSAVLDREPQNTGALIAESDALIWKEDYKGAEEVLEKVKSLAPDAPEGYYRMGRLYRTQEKFDPALKEYEEAFIRATGAPRDQLLSEIVGIEFRLGRTEAAKERLRDLLEEDPDNQLVHGLLGTIYARAGDLEEAEAEFEKQLEVNDRNPLTYVQLATVRVEQNNISGAKSAFQDGLKVLPDDQRLLLGLAGLYEKAGEQVAALDIYEKILSTNPDSLLVINNVAALLADNRTDEASLNRAKDLSDKLAEAEQPALRDTVGWVSYRAGDYDSAVTVLEGVVNDAPQIPVFQYHLGMALFKQGNTDQAKEHLAKAIELGDFNGAEEAKSTLESLE